MVAAVARGDRVATSRKGCGGRRARSVGEDAAIEQLPEPVAMVTLQRVVLPLTMLTVPDGIPENCGLTTTRNATACSCPYGTEPAEGVTLVLVGAGATVKLWCTCGPSE